MLRGPKDTRASRGNASSTLNLGGAGGNFNCFLEAAHYDHFCSLLHHNLASSTIAASRPKTVKIAGSPSVLSGIFNSHDPECKSLKETWQCEKNEKVLEIKSEFQGGDPNAVSLIAQY